MSVSTEEKSEALGQSDVAFSEEVDGEASEAFENIPRRRTSSEALSEASCSISSITSTNSSSNSVANNSNCNSVSETDSAVSTPPLTPGLTEKDKDTDSSSVGENGGDMHSPITISHLLRTRSLSSARRKCLASGPKFKLLQEGDIQVCRLNHTRTVISKILSSKFLRRWETHHLILRNSLITSRTRSGFMETAIAYSQIEDVYVVSRWDAGNKFCVRVVVPDGSVLLQAHSAYVRDQWMHSIQWKRNIYKFHELLKNATRSEILLKELKNLVDTTVSCALQDECIHQVPLDIASDILQRSSVWMPRSCHEDIIIALAPLLENNHPTPEICDFFSQHCRNSPRSSLVTDMFTTVVQRILKHNVDFGKYPKMRTFVQNYILALGSHNDGLGLVRGFVMSVHGAASTCPHPRVLHNLVSIGLAAIFSLFEERRNATTEEKNEINSELEDWDHKLLCFIAILETMVSYEDWRPGVAHLLQPIPFPDDALAHSRFTSSLKRVIRYIATDSRCDVHVLVQSVREGKEGWFQLYCPGSLACDDEGQLWSTMLKTLVGCCCRRKKFLTPLNKQLGALMLLAIRDDITCQEVLCAMLELDVVENPDYKLQMVSTLQSTTTGKQHYAALCDRQMHLRELQQKGGPKKLTLPSRSTDADVAKLLSCGSFGNLECLSLAFTHVTSACAEQLVKLPSLRYLNLWSTQFGDAGLQLISEHLHKLQVLNLCETPVTDKGLVSLAAMKNLRKLNLNSTSLSAETFEGLKQKLPALQECDVRYTDAW